MNIENFVVRPQRRLVEKYAQPEAWLAMSLEDMATLSGQVAGLPSELETEPEETKRFDLLVLKLQLALLREEPAFTRPREQVKEIAGALTEKTAIPMVNAQMLLIQDVQSDMWWQNVTVPLLEQMRRRLRNLVRLMNKHQRKPIYTDFEDEMGSEVDVELSSFNAGDSFEKFRRKARAFLRAHQDHITIHKLRMNQPLTPLDLEALEQMLNESGVGSAESIAEAKQTAQGLACLCAGWSDWIARLRRRHWASLWPAPLSRPIRSSSSTSSSTT